jgi:hypothetical protein
LCQYYLTGYCACNIIYAVIVQEDFKKAECMQIAYDQGYQDALIDMQRDDNAVL